MTQAGLELLALEDQRQVEIEIVKSRFRTDDIAEKAEEYGDKAWEAVERVVEYPARSLADVLSKLDWGEEHEIIEEQLLEAVTADLRRLAGEVCHG